MKIRIDDKVVSTKKAQRVWEDATYFDGRNWIHKTTGSQWAEQRLYLSSKGNYYIIEFSAWQGTTPRGWFVSPREAAEWLMLNNHKLPNDLIEYKDAIE